MSISRRKNQHIKLVEKSQTQREFVDSRFNYEPLLNSHTDNNETFRFLGNKIGAPIFISSMTGGSKKSEKINRIIAGAAKNFKLPMGLGSLRPYIENRHVQSFNIRRYIGDEVLLFGNLGITQVEQLLARKEIFKIDKAIEELELDGIIIHINPLQEWVQPEGDRLINPPIITLEKVLPQLKTKIIIKEVGAGFGKESLKSLLQLPIDVIDLSSFGGTNFTKLELLRNKKSIYNLQSPLINIGETPDQMIQNLNSFFKKGIGLEKEFIISGGIKNFLDGYYYNTILNSKSIYGYANNILKHAKKSEKSLHEFLEYEIRNYGFAQNFLQIKTDTCINI